MEPHSETPDTASLSSGDSKSSGSRRPWLSKRHWDHQRGKKAIREIYIGITIGCGKDQKMMVEKDAEGRIRTAYRNLETDVEDRTQHLLTQKLGNGYSIRETVHLLGKDVMTQYCWIDLNRYESRALGTGCLFMPISEVRKMAIEQRLKVHPGLKNWLNVYEHHMETLKRQEKNKPPVMQDDW